MSMIPDDKINEVRERASILEIVSDYVSLRKSGANYQGICPFHGEKTGSFNVNPARGIFHCFGCGVGGNAISFIMKIEGLSFPEAVKFLAKRVGVTIEERPRTATEKRQSDERELLYKINGQAAAFYRQLLLNDPAGEAGRQYLERRGVDSATSEAYGIGYAPDKWDSLTRHLEQLRVPLDLAEKLGLIKRREGGRHYDAFRNRLLFVIADMHGRPIGFGGRVLDDSLPKYINSPESPIYHKSEVLFGLNLSKYAMREKGNGIIVEGYFDHLALYQAGIRNVVATCGTALTTGHIKLLQRYANKVYTLFDGDSAGRKATLRSMELFLDEKLPASVIELPPGDDPDTFLKTQGDGAFAGHLAKAKPIFEFFFSELLGQYDSGTVEGKVGTIEALTPHLMKIVNPIERDLYIKEISRKLGVDPRQMQKKIGRSPVSSADLAVPRERVKPRSNKGPEETLISLMGKYAGVIKRVRDYGAANLFSADLLPIAEAIMAHNDSEAGIDWALLLEQIDSTEERSRLAGIFMDDDHLDEIDANKAFDQCRMSRDRSMLKDGDVKELKKELSRLDSDSERYWEILRKLDTLRNKKSQLL
ncbi:DNA primase [Geotalea daltonii FRC-32]|uniref:DNA primase n=1 Tax=Geotalea daltonii (strain DSM 22248 / JCM 15807 / FRC-32) TaxID=316067 RepID=B9M0M5_GEODF|nr:DNA primase [Geotalea daltonii]ACM19062.1 DNA primase [Geotalea daltonii FRC-32]